jgi:hydrogenase nickel incorporation protein HypA/HybF
MTAFARAQVCAAAYIRRTRGCARLGRVHELSVCQALLRQVTDIAMDRGADVVEHITIEAGPLSGVEPALLASAFEILRASSLATAQALLSIETPAVTIRCTNCGVESPTVPNRLVCPCCGDFRTRVVAGDELRLRRVELREPQSPIGRTLCAKPVVAA